MPILSLTFDAELAVGRIILSRNDDGAAEAGDFGAGAGSSFFAGAVFFGRGIGGCCEGRIEGRCEALLIVDARRESVRC